MKKWIIGSALVAIATLGVLFVVTAPTDEELIREAIRESTEASREGRPGGVLDYLSSNLSFNGIPINARGEISRYVRLAKPDIVFSDFEPTVTGDEAIVVADVRVKFDYPGINLDQTVPDVEVRLVKESGLRWLVLPGTKWRITEVTTPDLGQFVEASI